MRSPQSGQPSRISSCRAYEARAQLDDKIREDVDQATVQEHRREEAPPLVPNFDLRGVLGTSTTTLRLNLNMNLLDIVGSMGAGV